MLELLKNLWEGREWIFSGIGITVLTVIIRIVWVKRKSTIDSSPPPLIIKNIINIINKIQNKHSKDSERRLKTGQPTDTEGQVSGKKLIIVKEIKLYSKGARGKSFSLTFRKSFLSQIGIKVILLNNTKGKQVAHIRWVIRDGKNNVFFKQNRDRTSYGYGPFDADICVPKKTAVKMKVGKYTSECWINGKRVHMVEFYVTEK